MTNDEFAAAWRLAGDFFGGARSGASNGGAETAPPPESFLLSVSPNPFNPSTTITLTLPQAEWVKVEVFDIAGRPQGSPLREGWREAGRHTMTFDGSDLSSGVYLLRVEVSGLRQPRLQEGGQPRLQEGGQPRLQEGGQPRLQEGGPPRLQEARKLILLK
jgi:hypothetical protein